MSDTPKPPEGTISQATFEKFARKARSQPGVDGVMVIVFHGDTRMAEVAAAMSHNAEARLPDRLRKMAEMLEKQQQRYIVPPKDV